MVRYSTCGVPSVGPAVITDVRPHALGTPERQVFARIGDALIYLTDPAVAARIRQQWDAAQYLVAQRLPERISQTWLAPAPGMTAGCATHLPGRRSGRMPNVRTFSDQLDPRPWIVAEEEEDEGDDGGYEEDQEPDHASPTEPESPYWSSEGEEEEEEE